MIGTIVNTLAIVAGSCIGAVTKKGLNEKYEQALFNAIGLCAFCLGISTFCSGIQNGKFPVLFIVCLAFGTLIGTVLDIDTRFNKLTGKMGGADFSKGLSTAILLFCIGTLSILGPVQSALYSNNTFLYTNAMLDFVTSIVLSCTFGIGIMISGAVLFCFQGSIYLISLYAGKFISHGFFNELSIVGGILILSSGLSILKIKNLKTMNMLPALFMVPIFWLFIRFAHKILPF